MMMSFEKERKWLRAWQAEMDYAHLADVAAYDEEGIVCEAMRAYASEARVEERRDCNLHMFDACQRARKEGRREAFEEAARVCEEVGVGERLGKITVFGMAHVCAKRIRARAAEEATDE